MQGLTYNFMCGSQYANKANKAKQYKAIHATKQSINTLAKAYKVIVMQCKAKHNTLAKLHTIAQSINIDTLANNA